MVDQATALRGLMERRGSVPAAPAPREAKARTIAVTSGKGGVGKTNVALNLAIALAETEASVCLLDANLGLGNIDLLCGLNGYWNLSHVVSGARTLRDVVLDGPSGVRVVPGASGLTDIADCPAPAQQEILAQLVELERSHDFLVIDTGTGIHRTVRRFVAAADLALVVTTPEPTSIADAYATVKALASGEPPLLKVLVNQATSAAQVRAIVERLQQTARMFLHAEVSSAGGIPHDVQVPAAVSRRRPFLLDSPRSPASGAVRHLARNLKCEAAASLPGQSYFSRLWERVTKAA